MGNKPQEIVLAFPLDTKYRLVFMGKMGKKDKEKEKESPHCLNCSASLVPAEETACVVALKHLFEKWGLVARLEDLHLAVVIDTLFSEELRYRCYVFLAKHWQYADDAKRKMNQGCWNRLVSLPEEVWSSDHSWFLEVPRGCLKAQVVYDAGGSQLLSFGLQQLGPALAG